MRNSRTSAFPSAPRGLCSTLTLAAILMAGCKTKDVGDGDYTPPTDTGYVDDGCANCGDGDGDGYESVESGGADCDDTDPDVYPGAPETYYDGVDQACNGDDDEYDMDGDGYGSSTYGGDDCDDYDATINPAALEITDGLDNNCNGAIDDVDESQTRLWKLDGWGCGVQDITIDWNDTEPYPNDICVWAADQNILNCVGLMIGQGQIEGYFVDGVGDEFPIVMTGLYYNYADDSDPNGRPTDGWYCVEPAAE